MHNDFNAPQPSTRAEKSSVAAEVLGQKTSGKPRAPRFHRMSITAAQNGVSISHTVKVKRGKTSKTGEMNGASTPMSGDDMVEHSTEHVFGHDHPVMHHLNAIHKHMTSGLTGAAEGEQDNDGDSD